MSKGTYSVLFDASNRTYFDTLPEELLIEISILIKSDPILYKLSEYTKKAYIKYLNLIKNGYINTFDVNENIPVRQILMPSINKLYYMDYQYQDKCHYYKFIYYSDDGNYYYYVRTDEHWIGPKRKIKIYKKSGSNWKDFWALLNKEEREYLLLQNNYDKYMRDGLL